MAITGITTTDDERLYYGTNISQAPEKANRGSFFMVTDNGLETGNIIDTYVFTKVWEKLGGIELSDIPDASETQRGLVNTGTQTFSGNKIIKGGATGNAFEIKTFDNKSILRLKNKRLSLFNDVPETENYEYDGIIIKGNKNTSYGSLNNNPFIIKFSPESYPLSFFFDNISGMQSTTGNEGNVRAGYFMQGKNCFIETNSTGNNQYTKVFYFSESGFFGINTRVPQKYLDVNGDSIVRGKLEVSSTTQGFLPPRMTQAQRETISLPDTGLVVYQTDGTEGLYIKKSTGWVRVQEL